MQIRQATHSDIMPMVELLQELFALESDFSFSPNRHAQGLSLLLCTPNAMAWVAEKQNQIIAMITLQPHISSAFGQMDGILEDFVVRCTFRQQGIGSALMEHAKKNARQLGYTRLRLYADQSNETALHFYQSKQWTLGHMISLYCNLTPQHSTDLLSEPHCL